MSFSNIVCYADTGYALYTGGANLSQEYVDECCIQIL